MTRFFLRPSTALLLAATLLCGAGAVAEERKPEPKDLPGVEVEAPRPEPMQEPQRQPDGSIRVGDWDVRISGSISYEIGTSVDLK